MSLYSKVDPILASAPHQSFDRYTTNPLRGSKKGSYVLTVHNPYGHSRIFSFIQLMTHSQLELFAMKLLISREIPSQISGEIVPAYPTRKCIVDNKWNFSWFSNLFSIYPVPVLLFSWLLEIYQDMILSYILSSYPKYQLINHCCAYVGSTHRVPRRHSWHVYTGVRTHMYYSMY